MLQEVGMRIEVKHSKRGWDVLEGDVVVGRAPSRTEAIQLATGRVRTTGQSLQIIAEPEPERRLEVADVA